MAAPSNPTPKPSDKPASVREPSPTRPPDKPTPDKPERPLSAGDDEGLDAQTEGM